MSTLKQIEQTIKEMQEANCSESEILKQLEELIPPKVIQKPYESPRKDYFKAYNELKKRLSLISSEEQALKVKLDRAKQRKSGFCYFCKAHREIINPEVKLVSKRYQTKKKIIIESICPNCNKIIRVSGGFA